MKIQRSLQVKAGILIGLTILAVIGYLTLNINPKIRAVRDESAAEAGRDVGDGRVHRRRIDRLSNADSQHDRDAVSFGNEFLYALIHTAVVFFLGSGSLIARHPQMAFLVDLTIMGLAAMLIYGTLFRKMKHQILYDARWQGR